MQCVIKMKRDKGLFFVGRVFVTKRKEWRVGRSESLQKKQWLFFNSILSCNLSCKHNNDTKLFS